MPNVATLIKEEIIRLARKEHRAETESMKKTMNNHRTEITSLKRRMDALDRIGRVLVKRVVGNDPKNEDVSEKTLRFRPGGFQKLRKKLDLSATNMAFLIGVSAQTIYHWETGKTRPKAAQLLVIAGLRRAGKRRVHNQLKAQDSEDQTITD